MNKIKTIILFIYFGLLSLSGYSQSEKEVVCFFIDYLHAYNNQDSLFISTKLGGMNFKNNKACNNEYDIAKTIIDKLGIKVSSNQFKHLEKKGLITKKQINCSGPFKLIKSKQIKFYQKKLVQFSKPRFFNNNQNCFVSYFIGEYEFAYLILEKYGDKWKIVYTICESTFNT